MVTHQLIEQIRREETEQQEIGWKAGDRAWWWRPGRGAMEVIVLEDCGAHFRVHEIGGGDGWFVVSVDELFDEGSLPMWVERN